MRVPFLGTCGGFQHALIEYTRSVLGWEDAAHAENVPGAARALIAPLACPLVEASERLRLRAGSRLAAAYGRLEIEEAYHCSYGLNPEHAAALFGGPLAVSAEDAAGAVRAVELAEHPFFVATLFQPERRALAGEAPPPVLAFLSAAAVAASG
jgi:CTP synthase (UTP-ammonia lyase)